MKTTLKLEELAMALAVLFLLNESDVAWWWYLLFLLGPDISFLGYLAGNKTGAIVYNLFHHKGIAVGFIIAGYLLQPVNYGTTISAIGLVMLGHSSMDRFFGYGLKYFEGFKFTHLGQIGKR